MKNHHLGFFKGHENIKKTEEKSRVLENTLPFIHFQLGSLHKLRIVACNIGTQCVESFEDKVAGFCPSHHVS